MDSSRGERRVDVRIVRYRPSTVGQDEIITIAVSPENGEQTSRWVVKPTRDGIKINLGRTSPPLRRIFVRARSRCTRAIADALLDTHPIATDDDTRARLLDSVLYQLAEMRLSGKRVPSLLA